MHASNYETPRHEVANGVAEITLDRSPLELIDRDSTLEYHASLAASDLLPVRRAITARNLVNLYGFTGVKAQESI